MLIRAYTDADYEAVVALWATCGVSARAGEDKVGLQNIAAKNPGLFLLALNEQQQLIGTVYATFDGRRGWINHLCVAPPYRRAGLASQLLEIVESKLQDLGCPQINLLIFPDNQYNLENWYAKRGYQRRELTFMCK
jgi:ribosomal protein S18 acetylase RimI-like enzyme